MRFVYIEIIRKCLNLKFKVILRNRSIVMCVRLRTVKPVMVQLFIKLIMEVVINVPMITLLFTSMTTPLMIKEF